MALRKEGISQETLKVIACLSMLIDHIGAALLPWNWLRLVGRISFPIYCFLLVEGFHYSKSPSRYMLRLLLAAFLSEIPFDYALFGGPNWHYQSVMLTLLLGLLVLEIMEHIENPFCKLLVAAPIMLAAEWVFRSDYGGWGVLLIVLLGIVRDLPRGKQIQCFIILLICSAMPCRKVSILGNELPMELFGAFSIFPIALYKGRKASYSRTLQWGFYLFYPVHLAIIRFLSV